MKLHELKEMAYRGGNLTKQGDAMIERDKSFYDQSEYVGDIDTFKVKRNKNVFSLWDGDTVIASVLTNKIADSHTIVDDLWVRDTYRGKKILAKMLWYLKSRENFPKLVIGKLHSDDTYNIIKSGGLSNFEKRWYDINSGETAHFDINTVDDFYKSNKKSWSLMLEIVDEEYKNMPKIMTAETGYIKFAYDWQIK